MSLFCIIYKFLCKFLFQHCQLQLGQELISQLITQEICVCKLWILWCYIEVWHIVCMLKSAHIITVSLRGDFIIGRKCSFWGRPQYSHILCTLLSGNTQYCWGLSIYSSLLANSRLWFVRGKIVVERWETYSNWDLESVLASLRMVPILPYHVLYMLVLVASIYNTQYVEKYENLLQKICQFMVKYTVYNAQVFVKDIIGTIFRQ